MRNLILVVEMGAKTWIQRNKEILQRSRQVRSSFRLHERAKEASDQNVRNYLLNTPRQQITKEMSDQASYNKELREFIQQFNLKHKDKLSLLDYSNYASEFKELKNSNVQRQDLDLLREFQKRKIDAKIQKLRDHKTDLEEAPKNQDPEEKKKQEKLRVQSFNTSSKRVCSQGHFQIKDNFILYLIEVKNVSKSNKKGRIPSVSSLVFMGNGRGVISYGRGKASTRTQSIQNAIFQCKRSVIAIPRDPRCTLPLPLEGRFNDYRLKLKPIPGFNGWGHPTMTGILSAAGIDHCRFNTFNSCRNKSNAVRAFYKLITKNKTPRELAQEKGFKVYRHRFSRPLSEKVSMKLC